jgi:hypothetical protein
MSTFTERMNTHYANYNSQFNKSSQNSTNNVHYHTSSTNVIYYHTSSTSSCSYGQVNNDSFLIHDANSFSSAFISKHCN